MAAEWESQIIARSSRWFHRWLLTNRWCGEYIRNYREGRGIPRKQKTWTITLLWLMISSTALLAVSLWWVRPILLGVAVGVTAHLARIKTFEPEMQDAVTPRHALAPTVVGNENKRIWTTLTAKGANT